MNDADTIVAELLEELSPIDEGSGIFIKHLRNGPIYTCRCPGCQTLHGGFRTEDEARRNLKCKRCFSSEIEKKKRDIEKVDKPKPQKNIFQHPLNKRAVIETEDGADDYKDTALPIQSMITKSVNCSDDVWNSDAIRGKAFAWLSRIGGPKFGSRPIGWYQTEMCEALRRIQLFASVRGTDPKHVRVRGGHLLSWSPSKQRWVSIATPESLWTRPPGLREASDNDFDVKEVAFEEPDRVAYEICDYSEYYPVSTSGLIGRQGYKIHDMSGQWRVMGIKLKDTDKRFVRWPDLRKLLDAGQSVLGFVHDFDHGSHRVWGRPAVIYRKRIVNESSDDSDASIKDALLGMEDPTVVTKDVCLNAHHGQLFWDRQTGHAFRVSGRCKTWATRPHEYRIPVKFGLYQSFYITDANAARFSTCDPRAGGPAGPGGAARRV